MSIENSLNENEGVLNAMGHIAAINPSDQQIERHKEQAADSKPMIDSTFSSIFTPQGATVPIRVPDYQRAYSWEGKQVGLFLDDLKRYAESGRRYYFGHFIIEHHDDEWSIIDGQQRVTTLILFLQMCRHLDPASQSEAVVSLLRRFSTVSYDQDVFIRVVDGFVDYLALNKPYDPKHPPDSQKLRDSFGLQADLSRSQRLIVLALLQMEHAFSKGKLDRRLIPDYIEVVMNSHASHHLTGDRSVAVNIFEMHNTRGVQLTTFEVLKAVLMRSVYDKEERVIKAGPVMDSEETVQTIQKAFGEIYRMEEQLAERGFRGKMTMEQLLRHHLRVVDDGTKREKSDFQSPAADAQGEALVEYVRKRIGERDAVPSDVVKYALELTRELVVSMKIMSEHLVQWDVDCHLVGDVLILEPWLSCEFFLITCRRLEKTPGAADGRLGDELLKIWERFLFTRDFHGAYYRLWYKDDFLLLFSEMDHDVNRISERLQHYLANGFRDQTRGLPKLVNNYLDEITPSILNNAFYTWKHKMIYALYKYEVSMDVNLRSVMRARVSVEHILPQGWDFKWIDGYSEEEGFSPEEREKHQIGVGKFINGLGNLILLTTEENTRISNQHPADKRYPHEGGSYAEHHADSERWRSSGEWSKLIEDRGKKILKFIKQELVGAHGVADDG